MDLERQAQAPSDASFARRHPAGIACAILGVLAFGVTAWIHFGGDRAVADIPDARVTAPFLIAALGAGIAALIRREGAYALPLAGIGLAAGATVIGWTLVLAVIAAITGTVILILSEVM